MAESKKYYWLKLKRDFFKRHDIRIIEEMPNGKDYILFYLKLLLESIDHEGTLRFSDTIPYNEQMLSVVTNTNIDVVRSAMKIFAELHMIDIFDDQTIYMTEVDKLIGSETKWAEYKRKNGKLKMSDLPELTTCQRLSHEQILLPSGKVQYVDEKRYGGNAGLALDRAEGKCEVCGATENIVIHHNNGFSNELSDLIVVCRKCHRKLEKFQRDSKTFPTEIEQEKEKDKDSDSDVDVEETDTAATAESNKLKYLGGSLGKGVVFLTDNQFDDLIERLDLDAFNRYVERLADFIIEKNAHVKNHYETILKWYAQDSAVREI